MFPPLGQACVCSLVPTCVYAWIFAHMLMGRNGRIRSATFPGSSCRLMEGHVYAAVYMAVHSGERVYKNVWFYQDATFMLRTQTLQPFPCPKPGREIPPKGR